MNERKDILVYIESNPDGSAVDASLGLLSAASGIAAKRGGRTCALVIGGNCADAAASAAKYGAELVIEAEGEEYAVYSTEAYTAALCRAAEEFNAAVILLCSSLQGQDFGPRAACRLRVGIASDCTSVNVSEDGRIEWTRPSFSGSIQETVVCESVPQLATIRAGAFKKGEAGEAGAEYVKLEKLLGPEDIRTKLLEVIRGEGEETVDLAGADILVAGGMGMGGPEGIAELQALADALGGTIAASRAMVDEGWISSAYMVGQSGKTVAPKIYIACGISGAIQHVSGMRDSGLIIAINKDADAPIFKVADYGIVGNVHEILPLLTEAVKSLKA